MKTAEQELRELRERMTSMAERMTAKGWPFVGEDILELIGPEPECLAPANQCPNNSPVARTHSLAYTRYGEHCDYCGKKPAF